MGIEEAEWDSIEALVRRIFSTRADPFVTTRVSAVDAMNKLVFAKEFGVQPIPIVEIGYEVSYYDTLATGEVVKKSAKVKTRMPEVGEIILVARELGTHRLPRCLGVLTGTNWILTGDDD